ncbi:class I SAM-dependent methyltransferase [Kangiella sp.]|uniref:class I SAM-dependent methyltransferase n=1 Tax=Kangiella sp. TaxID=1920245 RepID=UPI0019A6D10A|nr:class I SAM-dependent methyltransferase [Kangiella sp.]MBD3653984.1 class I SAM-dependent methyltransferase [Kangiella sp.]
MNFQEVESVKQSLELGSHRLVDFLPFLFQDFKEIGSNTGFMLELIEQMGRGEPEKRVLDLCCGKGATLITLARHFKWTGIGVDVVDDFIQQAQIEAVTKGVRKETAFIRADLSEFLRANTEKFDVIVFPAATNILGDTVESLNILGEHIKDDGCVIVESDYKSHGFNIGLGLELTKNMDDYIADSILHAARKIVWKQSILVEVYQRDTQWLDKRVKELLPRQPEIKRELEQFIKNRHEHLQHYKDNEIARASWLLIKKI